MYIERLKNFKKIFEFTFANKKLFLQLSIVSIVLTLPIFYLLYFSFHTYKDSHSFTSLEIKGAQEIILISNEFNRLIAENPPKVSDQFRNKFSDLSKIKKEFNLSNLQFKELENINKNINSQSREEISDEFLAPLNRLISNNSKLILDPDITSYYLMDILALKSSRLYQILSRDSDFISIERLLKQIHLVLVEINYSISQVLSANQTDNPELVNLNLCLKDLNNEVSKQINDDRSFSFIRISNKLNVCNKINAHLLIQILNYRNELLLNKYILTFRLTLIIWLLGTIFGVYIYLMLIEQQIESSLKIVNQEKKILEAEKLSTLGELASSIVHEIKNPLMLIDHESGALYKRIDHSENKDEIILGKLKKISEMSQRINKISNMITIYTRNSQNDSFEEANSRKIIDDSVYITNLKAKVFSVDIDVKADPVFFHCRPYQVEQVLINLINNSIDAIEKLDERWINIYSEITQLGNCQWLRISIIDSGKGIEPEIQDKIFASFYSTKKAGKGTGVGLSVSLKIIEAHNGKLYYDSSSPNSKFILEIPLNLSDS
ncbi:MAG: ATP-binding protein [Bacteriovorax sp.]|nr:ATP-binding protein [Bacteriovorax sp.]